MGFIADLWLPILLSAVFVFIASSVIHMALPIHKNDYTGMPGEDKVLEAMRGQNVKPGTYMFPHCASFKELQSPEGIERFNKGPVGFMYVLPNGPVKMGKNLLTWFVFALIIGVFAGYLGSLAVPPGADYLTVFRITGTVAVLGYGASHVVDSIWKAQSWVVTGKFVFDGIVYGLLTAGTFAWLWPDTVV